MDKIDILYLALPLLLWPVVFIVFSHSFVYAMSVATFILAAFSLWRYRGNITWSRKGAARMAAAGIIGAVALYLAFLAGYYLSVATGMGSYVGLVYSMIYSQAPRAVIFVLLALIGLFEEIYWRGGMQGYAAKHSRRFGSIPWLASTIYYSLVHISTLNPVLVLAALLVGLVTSIIADRYGILASAMAHIAWIEAIIIFLPVIRI